MHPIHYAIIGVISLAFARDPVRAVLRLRPSAKSRSCLRDVGIVLLLSLVILFEIVLFLPLLAPRFSLHSSHSVIRDAARAGSIMPRGSEIISDDALMAFV